MLKDLKSACFLRILVIATRRFIWLSLLAVIVVGFDFTNGIVDII